MTGILLEPLADSEVTVTKLKGPVEGGRRHRRPVTVEAVEANQNLTKIVADSELSAAAVTVTVIGLSLSKPGPPALR